MSNLIRSNSIQSNKDVRPKVPPTSLRDAACNSHQSELRLDGQGEFTHATMAQPGSSLQW